jgi:ABC-type histidine transport system ATPase subunit
MFTKMTKKEMQDRVDFCLDRVNLQGRNALYPSECSGGMQKRVGIARAIAMNPKYLFCDEPNSGLDPKTAIVIDNLIRDITYEYGITTIVTTGRAQADISLNADGSLTFTVYPAITRTSPSGKVIGTPYQLDTSAGFPVTLPAATVQAFLMQIKAGRSVHVRWPARRRPRGYPR